jgi:Na+/H+ antiporter NhaD/arsenite permease-like protein
MFEKTKGWLKSGTIISNLVTLIAGLDALQATLVHVAPLLPPQMSATVVSVASIYAIYRRKIANAKIKGVL